jgi:1-acyl-sn-glycerol-3-phosphate acyltransferase
VPPFGPGRDYSARALEDIRKQADRPVVVFPECTTSNGRGLLRFTDAFGETVPVKNYQVFVMCVRYVPLAVIMFAHR